MFENKKRAVDFWRAAMNGACLDSQHAKYSYALCLSEGVGVDQRDEAAAVKLLEELDTKEHGLAQQALSGMYLKGVGGLPRDGKAAIRMLKKSARNGVITALTTMGTLKRTGYSVQENDSEVVVVEAKPDEARMLFQMAGEYLLQTKVMVR